MRRFVGGVGSLSSSSVVYRWFGGAVWIVAEELRCILL
jgi:hypothetical protein